MISSIRSTVNYTLFFVVLAVAAFLAYYQTIDFGTASTLTSATADSQGVATANSVAHAQSWVSSHAQPLAATVNAVKTGLVSVR
jgi:zona occludens toxin (predicted ATPase)